MRGTVEFGFRTEEFGAGMSDSTTRRFLSGTFPPKSETRGESRAYRHASSGQTASNVFSTATVFASLSVSFVFRCKVSGASDSIE